MTEVSHLNHIHALDLSYSTVSDVSSLTDVHTLNLTRCNILKVGALKKCHTLILQSNGLVQGKLTGMITVILYIMTTVQYTFESMWAGVPGKMIKVLGKK